MKYRPLGKSGIQASVVGFGAWAIGGWMWGGTKRNDPQGAIRAAVDHGINLIDTAPMYGYGKSEELVGDALKGLRDKVVLATKCGMVWYKKEGDKFFDANEIAFLAYSPMALGILSGKIGPNHEFGQGDVRQSNPWYQKEARPKVDALLDVIRSVAEDQRATIAQTVIAWTLEQPGCSHAL